MDKFKKQEKRIEQILLGDGIESLDKTSETIQKYREYLKANIELPCKLTGIEDFSWEERYVFGYGDPDEYEEFKEETSII